MKRIIVSLLLIINFNYLYSQKIIGKVYDNTTKEPIAEVSVYLNGTTYNTKTNNRGEFELFFDKKINTDLIISRVGYNMVSIPNPYDRIPEKIFLTQTGILDEIVIETTKRKGFSRKEMLKMFKKGFIGESKAAGFCNIRNEDDIDLIYDYDNHRLMASVKEPIVIENKYLGYIINFQMYNFYIQYNNSSRYQKVITILYTGGISFNDLSDGNKKISKRRESVYKNSRRFFFKNLANKTLKKARIDLYAENTTNKRLGNIFKSDAEKALEKIRGGASEEDMIILPENYFVITDILFAKKVTLLPNRIWNTSPTTDGRVVYGRISILNDDKYISHLAFLTDIFYIDQYGNTYFEDKNGNAIIDDLLMFSGHIGNQRMGDTLPLDYELGTTSF